MRIAVTYENEMVGSTSGIRSSSSCTMWKTGQ